MKLTLHFFNAYRHNREREKRLAEIFMLTQAACKWRGKPRQLMRFMEEIAELCTKEVE